MSQHFLQGRKSEVRAVNCGMTAECLSTIWINLHEGSADSDIFSADETGLSFRLTPERTLKSKGRNYVDGKLAK